MNDIRMIPFDMPVHCKGQVRITPDGDYYVFVNSRYNIEQQKEIYNHEVRHIIKNHHHVVGDITDIELEANDKNSLLEEIRRVEKCGLPLDSAILKSDIEDNTIQFTYPSAEKDSSHYLDNALAALKELDMELEKMDEIEEFEKDQRRGLTASEAVAAFEKKYASNDRYRVQTAANWPYRGSLDVSVD